MNKLEYIKEQYNKIYQDYPLNHKDTILKYTNKTAHIFFVRGVAAALDLDCDGEILDWLNDIAKELI